jgi:stearoyl-CoA desaturase (Delta-9 desaturase)
MADFVVEHTMSAINSICHMIGSRDFAVRGDNSRNNSWLGLPTWGEAFHNNHHAFPSSAAFGLRWHELDPGFWFVRLLQFLGLAWNVKTPSTAAISRHAAADDAASYAADSARLNSAAPGKRPQKAACEGAGIGSLTCRHSRAI